MASMGEEGEEVNGNADPTQKLFADVVAFVKSIMLPYDLAHSVQITHKKISVVNERETPVEQQTVSSLTVKTTFAGNAIGVKFSLRECPLKHHSHPGIALSGSEFDKCIVRLDLSVDEDDEEEDGYDHDHSPVVTLKFVSHNEDDNGESSILTFLVSRDENRNDGELHFEPVV